MKDLFPVDFKDIFRGLIFSILSAALVLCLFFLTYSLVFTLVTSKPAKVKDIFQRSSLYSDLPVVLYDQAVKETGKGTSDIPLKDPRVRQIVLDAYDPGFVQNSTEKLIDGFYGWLDGDTASPKVDLDFAAQNKLLAEKIGEYGEKRAEKLPICTMEQLRASEEFHIFKADCLPPDITPKEVKKAALTGDNKALDFQFSVEDIKTADGQPLYKSFANLPESFSLAKTIPPILVVLALILMTVIVYISKDKINGLKRVSRAVLGAGILIAFLPVIFNLTGESILRSLSGDDRVMNIVRTLFEEFMRDAGKIYYSMGILFILIGAGIYMYARKQENDNDKIPKLKS